LVGAISHHDYRLWSQDSLNEMGDKYELRRPVTYDFPSVEQLLADVDAWKGKEGVCVYSRDGQYIHKVKGAWYLALHRMKEQFGSIEHLIDAWFSWGSPEYQKAEEIIVTQFDYELFQTCRGDISRICDAWKEVQKIEAAFQKFVDETLKPLPSRKDQAIKTVAAYGQTNRASFIFKLLDGKTLGRDDQKKLLYQVLKK
jgi:hypothetical protein